MGRAGEQAFQRTILNCLPDLAHPGTTSVATAALEGVKRGHIFKFVDELHQQQLASVLGYVGSIHKSQMPEFVQNADANWLRDVKHKLARNQRGGNLRAHGGYETLREVWGKEDGSYALQVVGGLPVPVASSRIRFRQACRIV